MTTDEKLLLVIINYYWYHVSTVYFILIVSCYCNCLNPIFHFPFRYYYLFIMHVSCNVMCYFEKLAFYCLINYCSVVEWWRLRGEVTDMENTLRFVFIFYLTIHRMLLLLLLLLLLLHLHTHVFYHGVRNHQYRSILDQRHGRTQFYFSLSWMRRSQRSRVSFWHA